MNVGVGTDARRSGLGAGSGSGSGSGSGGLLVQPRSPSSAAGSVETLLRVEPIVGALVGGYVVVEVIEEADHHADLAAQVLHVAGLVVGVAERVAGVEGHHGPRIQGLRHVRQGVVCGQAALGRLHVLARLAVLVARGLLAERWGLVPGTRVGRDGDDLATATTTTRPRTRGGPSMGATVPGVAEVAKAASRIFA
jgi:hypothetical protein